VPYWRDDILPKDPMVGQSKRSLKNIHYTKRDCV
jgi:hypothetical protein